MMDSVLVVCVGNICRWVDFALFQDGRMEAIEAQTHRRVLKSHLPADALVVSPQADVPLRLVTADQRLFTLVAGGTWPRTASELGAATYSP